jgi:hypothetical protein
MESASDHAYVSKNFIEAYLKKKEKQKKKKDGKKDGESSLGMMQPAASGMKQYKEDEAEVVDERPQMPMPTAQFGGILKSATGRRRSRSRSRSASDEDEDQRARSVESLFAGELRGNLNLSDCEPSHSPPRMQYQMFDAFDAPQ